MKHVLALFVVACAVVGGGMAGYGQWEPGQWERLPSEHKTEFTVHGLSGSAELSIMCFPNTEENWEILLGDVWSERAPLMRQMVTNASIHFSGDASLVVFVAAPYSNQYWSPRLLVITQDLNKYSIHVDDFMRALGPFNGGQIMAETSAWGFIRVPRWVDLTRPFQVRYREDSGEIESFFPVIQSGGTTQ